MSEGMIAIFEDYGWRLKNNGEIPPLIVWVIDDRVAFFKPLNSILHSFRSNLNIATEFPTFTVLLLFSSVLFLI